MQASNFSSLHIKLSEIALKKQPIDLALIYQTLENTNEVDLVALCFEALFSHRNEIIEELAETLKKKTSASITYAIIFICSLEPDNRAMNILLNEYLASPTYRSLIKKQGFQDKKHLALCLMVWLEQNKPDADTQKTILALCALIPRKTLLMLPNFSHSKLSEYYFRL